MPGEPDAARELTPKGSSDVANVVRLGVQAGLQPVRILTSPLIRARQTAEVAIEICGGRLSVTDALLPEASPSDTWRVLMEEGSDAMLVGHGPHFPRMVSFLLGARAALDFKKGALLRIDASSPGQGLLRWFLTPKVARRHC